MADREKLCFCKLLLRAQPRMADRGSCRQTFRGKYYNKLRKLLRRSAQSLAPLYDHNVVPKHQFLAPNERVVLDHPGLLPDIATSSPSEYVFFRSDCIQAGLFLWAILCICKKGAKMMHLLTSPMRVPRVNRLLPGSMTESDQPAHLISNPLYIIANHSSASPTSPPRLEYTKESNPTRSDLPFTH